MESIYEKTLTEEVSHDTICCCKWKIWMSEDVKACTQSNQKSGGEGTSGPWGKWREVTENILSAALSSVRNRTSQCSQETWLSSNLEVVILLLFSREKMLIPHIFDLAMWLWVTQLIQIHGEMRKKSSLLLNYILPNSSLLNFRVLS